MSTLAKVNAVWRVPLILLATAILASLSIMTSLFDGSGRLQHGCARLWGRLILLVSRVRVELEGLDNLQPGRGYILAANHLSMFDHWALLACLPVQFRFVSKASLFRLPFVGWHLKRSGNIAVDPRTPRRTVRSYRAVREKIQSGLSFLVYPEGMRTFGEMAPFKRGAFLLAFHSQAPIIPITINEAHKRLRRGSSIIHSGRIGVVIHPALEFEDYRHKDLDVLASEVRAIILSHYEG